MISIAVCLIRLMFKFSNPSKGPKVDVTSYGQRMVAESSFFYLNLIHIQPKIQALHLFLSCIQYINSFSIITYCDVFIFQGNKNRKLSVSGWYFYVCIKKQKLSDFTKLWIMVLLWETHYFRSLNLVKGPVKWILMEGVSFSMEIISQLS